MRFFKNLKGDTVVDEPKKVPVRVYLTMEEAEWVQKRSIQEFCKCGGIMRKSLALYKQYVETQTIPPIVLNKTN